MSIYLFPHSFSPQNKLNPKHNPSLEPTYIYIPINLIHLISSYLILSQHNLSILYLPRYISTINQKLQLEKKRKEKESKE